MNADLFFVTFSSEDVAPDKLFIKKMKMRLKKPFIHLQSGFIGLTKVMEMGESYDNNILRFLVYNKNMMNVLHEEHGFNDYQLQYELYQPKYGDLVRPDGGENQILWFLDNRNYFKNDFLLVKSFSSIIGRIVEDNELIDYLKTNNLKFKICIHAFIEDNVFNDFKRFNNEFIEVVRQSEINMQEEIANCKLFITDYSHYIYDASFIGKPYVIFQPDFNNYIREGKFYYGDELIDFIIKKPYQLIDVIVNEDFKTSDYIDDALPDNIDFDYIKRNNHLNDFYYYYKKLQLNKITFIGYNFYGIGGTVNATMALAESLLEEDYWVETISLKRLTEILHVPPVGLNLQYITWDGSGSIVERIKRKRYNSPKYYSYLEYDRVKRLLSPYVGYALNKLMKNIKSRTVVSTRESLHLFLNDCSSEHVKNRIYFFHTIADVVPSVFPNLMDVLTGKKIDKAVFITKQNRFALKEKFDYDNYNEYLELGNTLLQSKMLQRDEITPIDKKDNYRAIYLLRIIKDRKDDLNNLIEFGKYAKQNGVDNIEIDVFGAGDYVNKFIEQIENNDLQDIIHYRMSTNNPITEIRKHDLMIDFSLNHSFGMTYIEAVLNGKKVYCMKNPGSIEVMENIPNSFIESYEWLSNQLRDLDKITIDELKENYDKINNKYSQKAIADKFIGFLD